MKNRKKRYFLQDVYMGSDRDEFQKDFVEYLKNILSSRRFVAMSDHQLFLDGGIEAIKEIIDELE